MMKYEVIRDGNTIQILPEGRDIKEFLLTFARLSYGSAKPRHTNPLEVKLSTTDPNSYEGAQVRKEASKRPFLHSIENMPKFEDYLESDSEGLNFLVMDYINGRDCRTMLRRGDDSSWYFNAYAFEQREVTSEEFISGIRRVNAEEFLKEVLVQYFLEKADETEKVVQNVTLKLVEDKPEIPTGKIYKENGS